MMLSMFISPSAMVVVVVVNERAQSNVTDITSGHKAAADCGLAGGCETGECGGPVSQSVTPGMDNTFKLRFNSQTDFMEISQQQQLFCNFNIYNQIVFTYF